MKSFTLRECSAVKIKDIVIFVVLFFIFYAFISPAGAQVVPQQTKLTANDGAAGDAFGLSISVSGDRIVIGAPLDDDKGADSGSAYTYKWNGNDWVETKLLVTDGADFDYFGSSVSVSGDRVVVGEYGDDVNGSMAGAIHVYEWFGNLMGETTLRAADGESGDQFGRSVAVSGNRIVVGAWVDDSTGSAYAYNWNGLDWIETKLYANDGALWDYFGWSVSVSGNRIVVGAYGDDDNGIDSGAAYVYYWNGVDWVFQTKIRASDGAPYDRFGTSVAVKGDWIAVGAPLDDDKGADSGSAYLYKWNGIDWVETKFVAIDGVFGDYFGQSVSVSENRVVVGASLGNERSGSVYVYEWNGIDWVDTLLHAIDGTGHDSFGSSVSVSGNRVVVGAFKDDDNGTDSGSAYIFTLVSQECTPNDTQACDTGVPGICAAGTQTCSEDGLWGTCVQNVEESEEICDGLDNDCNGANDDGFNIGSACDGVGACGEGVIECADLTTTRCSTDPGGSVDQSSAEICDGLDNDCDGDLDGSDASLILVLCENQQGVCAGAMRSATRCVSGAWQICTTIEYSNHSADFGNEICDGLDNNCSGETDEGFALDVVCDGADTDLCENGTTTCKSDGTGVECVNEIPANIIEVCDGSDNDCDGAIDEGFDIGNACDGVGECGAGVTECADLTTTRCSTDRGGSDDQSRTEVCDGQDNDCDGLQDGSENLLQQCGTTDEGACSFGTEICDDFGNWGGCSAIFPAAEVCDGVDSDCDGVQDGAENLTQQCGTTATGECSLGTESCDDGGNWVGCDAVFPVAEICDDVLDNDCDGDIDLDDTDCQECAPDNTQSCNTGLLGVCSAGTETCGIDGFWGACVQDGQPSDEICDGLDNDCDGMVDGSDESLTMPLCENQQGVCAGALRSASLCVSGVWGSCTSSEYSNHSVDFGNEMCDGRDNDCDSETDEDFALDVICDGTDSDLCENGTTTCTEDGLGVECVNENPVDLVEICDDNLDNDCDSMTDTDPECGIPMITSPAPESTLFGSSGRFAWTDNGMEVSGWYLWAGPCDDPAYGGCGDNYYNSGLMASGTTETIVTGLLEDGSTIYVRLWFNENGTWDSVLYTYTAYTMVIGGDPEITNPAPDSTLSGPSVDFTWTANGTEVSEWWLWVGPCSDPSVGGCGDEYFNSGSMGSSTSHVVTGLPTDGSQVFVRLWYNTGTWQSVDFQYTAHTETLPEMTSPEPGSTCSGTTETFSWTANTTPVSEWWLWAGTSPGGEDIMNSGSLGSSTSYTVTGLPIDGSQIYISLHYNTGEWESVDYQYTAHTGSVTPPEITSPAPDSTLSGSSVDFTWTANTTTVYEWWLWAGTSVGGSDIMSSGNLLSSTSYTVTGLPIDGSQIYMRLHYNTGEWESVDYQYTAYTAPLPTITSPDPDSTLSGSSVDVTWSANGTAVSGWWLWAGSCDDPAYGGCGDDYFYSGSMGSGTLSRTVTGLPTDGSTIYMRLWYNTGTWESSLFQYTGGL